MITIYRPYDICPRHLNTQKIDFLYWFDYFMHIANPFEYGLLFCCDMPNWYKG